MPTSLTSISPIDGRYRKYTESLARYFSEEAFMRYRVKMESEYLIALAESLKFKSLKFKVRELAEKFSNKDAEEIKEIEKTTNHDLKAIEYWMRRKIQGKTLKKPQGPVLGNWIHFGLTSEDASNIAYGMMTLDALREVVIPAIDKIAKVLKSLSGGTAQLPMLARTHGQPASPTTFGKEIAVFATRLARQIKQIKAWKAPVKLNGATGNYNALVAAYPKIDWIAFSKKFISSLSTDRYPLYPVLVTTQIEPHDGYAELFDILRRLNVILIDFNQDIWRYVSDGWLAQKPVAGEVGSSTMPHKINPWFLENSEGNLGVANALFQHLAIKLPVSRLQRDLSDSTVFRNVGVALGHSLVGYEYLLKAIERLDVNAQAMRQALEDHPEVLAEAIQTILRREGAEFPYEKLKELTRGKSITMDTLRDFINGLYINEKVKKELLALEPAKYTGLAARLAKL